MNANGFTVRGVSRLGFYGSGHEPPAWCAYYDERALERLLREVGTACYRSKVVSIALYWSDAHREACCGRSDVEMTWGAGLGPCSTKQKSLEVFPACIAPQIDRLAKARS